MQSTFNDDFTSMSGPKYSAKLVYGSLPVLPVPEADDIQVLGFAINGFRKGLRLTLAHRGTLFYVVLFRDAQSLEAGPSFCQRVFDGVKDTWHTDKAGKFWSDRNNYSHMHAGSSVIVQLEDELFELVRGALPHLLERATDRRQGSLTGSQLWAEVTADADAAGRPRVTLVGDIFRELVHNDLPLLSDTDFPHIPRHDLSAVDGYIGVITDAICIVASQQLNSVHSH
ncbi:unnamed protein product [Tilletia laevis]|uniref:Uncharacterized protein n=2 Tax=Tilletia TaxID=13289 RepID=A0A9N8LRR5_9BASI|nr:unnamed protein product [Tilletia caries]CAD6909413.1 unnamed protein product [Tilletia controversa]CAD6916700.1 unnamed protein product [Tilletia laevis]CAD6926865.1 unnamed protein product [Tilletia laevis]CAD6939787.1 unnamed protein product [Tilletia caries]